MVSCLHVNSEGLKPPGPSQPVYREDCTQCFDTTDEETGLNVCLSCFNGGCTGDRNHAFLHYKRFGHPLALNIKRSQKKVQRDEPPQKISKLAIAAETDEDRYDTTTRVVCYACCMDDVDKSIDTLWPVVEGVMKALNFSQREEVKAWEQEFVPCDHTLGLVQQDSKKIEPNGLGQCAMCDLKGNLWLCLECGNLGCGRSQFGGTGGNSHALAHANASSHAVSVKLGSITAEGSADVYCYKCNEERVDPYLAAHLSQWGINIADRQKTEKSLTELQIDQNLKWEFSMTSDDGRELRPVFGPGFTGLINMGNSCYLSSIVQCLFSLQEFQGRYFHPMEEPPFTPNPAGDLETQMRKLADGILSGRYSKPDTRVVATPDSPEVPHQNGISPTMFKHLIGRGHEEFSTMRQQDAFEFLLHLFKLISLSRHPSRHANPIQPFRFAVEQRLQCMSCNKVRYRVDEQDNISIPVPARRTKVSENENSLPTEGASNRFEPVSMQECLDIFTAEEIVEFNCPSCGSKDGFRKRALFKTLPSKLVINARRFELLNWVPTKLDIPVEVGDEPLDFGSYMSPGHIEGEELLPDSEETFEPNQEAFNQLLAMGFPEKRSEKALHATGNTDTESAMNWLFAHMEDPDIDEPLVINQSATKHGVQQDPEKVQALGEMGIDVSRARIALAATDGDVNRALDWVFSHPELPGEDEIDNATDNNSESRGFPGFETVPAKYQLQSIVCHKGASVHAGHYVAFVRKPLPGDSEPTWVMFNDEKVVKADDVREMKQFAYLYFFSRV